MEVTHSVWPWISKHAGFLFTSFEVGRDGKTAYERLKNVQGLSFPEGVFWRRKRAGGPLGSLTCGRMACIWASQQPREKSSW